MPVRSFNRKSLSTIAFGATLVSPIAMTQMNTASAASSSSSILDKIAYCESGNNYSAQNPTSTASGKYQFLDTTWQSLEPGSGYARAKDAPASLQDEAAAKLYAEDGTSPWVSSQGCWGKLGSAPTASSGATTNTSSRVSAGSSTATTSQTTQSASNAEPNTTSISMTSTSLLPEETSAVDQINRQLDEQSWWTLQARNGTTITRHIVLATKNVVLHSNPSFDQKGSVASDLANGDAVIGHYVNADWFEITSGVHAGSYISSGVLERIHDETPAHLSPNQLATLPSWMQAGNHGLVSVNPQLAKSLVELSAAYRHQFGVNLKVSDGYDARSKNLGHELGQSVDFANAELKDAHSAQAQWLDTYATNFGIDHSQTWSHADLVS